MKITAQSAVASVTILLTAINLTSGCSCSREDVRVTLCKDLTSALVDSPQALVWKGHESTFRRPEYVAVKVLYEIPDKTTAEAVCFYAYNTPEEDAMTQSRPLSAYSTLPYKMELNGESVSQSVLSDGIKSQQRKLGRKILDSLQQWVEDTTKQFSNGLERN